MVGVKHIYRPTNKTVTKFKLLKIVNIYCYSIQIILVDNRYATLCKPTKSSSVYEGNIAGLAVDGNPASYFHSISENRQWISVDLEEFAFIYEVKVFNHYQFGKL